MKRLTVIAVACISAAAIASGCSGGGGSTATTASNSTTGGSTVGGTGGSTSGSTGGGGTPATVKIMVINNAAAPMGFSFQSPVTATSGQPIAWVNQSTAEHRITWDAQTPNSSPSPGANIPIFQPGTTSNTFEAPTVTVATVYHYHCTVHGPTVAGVIDINPVGAGTTGDSTTSGSTTSGSTTSGSTTSGSTTGGVPVY